MFAITEVSRIICPAAGVNPKLNSVVSRFERSAAILAAPVPAGSRRYGSNQDTTLHSGTLFPEKSPELHFPESMLGQFSRVLL
jgi:hypothetical protein